MIKVIYVIWAIRVIAVIKIIGIIRDLRAFVIIRIIIRNMHTSHLSSYPRLFSSILQHEVHQRHHKEEDTFVLWVWIHGKHIRAIRFMRNFTAVEAMKVKLRNRDIRLMWIIWLFGLFGFLEARACSLGLKPQ